jgi:pre-mRNA-splicing factor ATP-dependent RNA helicase DHX15/PRP43
MASNYNDSEDGIRTKRQKTSTANMDPRSNPYLAHMYPEEKDISNGAKGSDQSVLKTFKRHVTTARDAMSAEDGPNNPFTGQKLSQRYFDILKTRRNLPVHAQR